MFGELVRAHRTKVMVTQEELAERAGVSVRHLREIEAGRVASPRASTIRLLADALRLSDAERLEFQRLGREPSSSSPLRQLTPQILGGTDPARSAGAIGSEARYRRPAQLPRDVPHFCGRQSAIDRLDAILTAASEQPHGVPVVAICGTAGVGKTTLAVHWAHRVAGEFPHGHLYVNLHDFDPAAPPVSHAEAVRQLLDALGVPPQRIPLEPAAQLDLYRSLLTGLRVLVVLDNARDSAQVRPLLPGSPGCLAIVTSRDQLIGHERLGMDSDWISGDLRSRGHRGRAAPPSRCFQRQGCGVAGRSSGDSPNRWRHLAR